MKKTKQKKATIPSESAEKASSPTPVLIEPLASAPEVRHRSLDPEREELVYDERGEACVRLTPRGMLEDAQAEVDQLELADYDDSISLLRDKGLSFREIAEFLSKRGVSADHNAVYRVYTKGMDAADIQDMEQDEQRRADDERDALR